MKNKIKRSSRYVLLILALCAAVFPGCSCSSTKAKSDPLPGFYFCSLANLQTNKVILEDYQNFIQDLSPRGNKITGPIQFSQDSNGRHAITIEVFVGGTASWTYILIYDKDNKRVQAIKYRYNRYQS